MPGIISLQEPAIDVFDLSGFAKQETGHFHKVFDAYKYLEESCNELDIQHMENAVNPVRLSCRRLQGPSVNSHGEVELWVTDATKELYNWEKHSQGSFRCMEYPPQGAVLCIDTQHILDLRGMRQHSYMFFQSTDVYGNVRTARKAGRHVPGRFDQHFIEIGAIYYYVEPGGDYCVIGICGKGLNTSVRGEE